MTRSSSFELASPNRPSLAVIDPVAHSFLMEPRLWHKKYEPGIPTSLDYPDRTIPAMLSNSAKRFPDNPAVIFSNTRLTYAQLDDQVNRLATALQGMGVGEGTRVAIYMPNLPQTVISFFAVLRLGGVAVMTNPLYTSREIQHQWTDAGVTVAIMLDFLYEGRVKPIREHLGVEHFVIASIPEYLRFPLNLIAPLKLKRANPPMIAKVSDGPGIYRFKQTIRRTTPNISRDVPAMDDLALLQYTGGTTGVSKGAMLTHRCVSANVVQISRWNTTLKEGEEIMVACLPFFHIYGLTVVMLHAANSGLSMVLIPNPRDIGSIVKGIVKNKATMCPAVPAMYQGINKYPNIESFDMSSVGVCNSGSAPLPVEVLQEFERLTGAKITEGYGLTESSPVIHSNPAFGERKIGSIGIPLPDTDVKIVDLEDGVTEVAPGEPGELIAKGPQIFAGYWNRADETAATLRDGWLYTGDIAQMDEDGFFFIVGRKKDMILASGYNIYPDEIDRVLMGHPDILESATIGVPDEKRGETVKSFVVLHQGHSLSEEDIVAYCKENLAAYKVPRQIEFRDALPKSTVLKILRRELRDEELAKA